MFFPDKSDLHLPFFLLQFLPVNVFTHDPHLTPAQKSHKYRTGNKKTDASTEISDELFLKNDKPTGLTSTMKVPQKNLLLRKIKIQLIFFRIERENGK